MSYDPDPSHYINGSFIIWHLADVCSKGGLMQIGYGPDKHGDFHPLAVKALEQTGDWLAVNGEAIYATRPMPEHWNDTRSDFVRYTRSKPKISAGATVGDRADSGTIYAITLTDQSNPGLQPLITLGCVVPEPQSTIMLLGYNQSQVSWKQVTFPDGKHGVEISVPPQALTSLQGPGYVFKITGSPALTC
jgi:hypothetical protein